MTTAATLQYVPVQATAESDTSSSNTIVDATATVEIGPTATAVQIGGASVATQLLGGATVPTGKAVTGSGAMAVEATGALSIGVNASTTSVVAGQAGVPLDLKGGFTVASGDAGGAGTTGTVNKRMGTFTLTGQTFTLTNTTIATGDLAWVMCQTAAPGAYIASAVTSGSATTLVVTFSASVTSMKCAFLLSAAG